MEITTVGLDIAKRVFQLHGVDAAGKAVLRRKLQRSEVLAFFGCVFVGPLVILLVLDWISRRVIADRTGKFGPKVPTVGKWNSTETMPLGR